MAQIFNSQEIDDPSFYVYMASKIDPSMAPKDKDGLYVLMPVSELSLAQYDYNDDQIASYKEKILSEMEKIQGFETVRDSIASETIITPNDFADKFYAFNGSTFGLRPTLKQSNHLRPQVKQDQLENMYFVGSSVHPGASVPIVLLSAQIAADQLVKDDQKTRTKGVSS